MTRRILVCTAAVLLAAVPATFGQGRKGKNQTVTQETTPQDYASLARLKGVTAKIMSFDAASNRITIRIEYQVAQPGKQNVGQKNRQPKRPNIRRPQNRRPQGNRNGRRNNGNSQQQLAREYQKILRIQNPAQRQQQMQRFMAKVAQQRQRAIMEAAKRQQQAAKQYQQQLAKARQQAAKNKGGNRGGVKMTMMAKEFTLAVSDKVRVAKKNLGLEFDEKGFVKEYTPEEKQKMRDEKLPGYKAKVEEVQNGQTAYLYLAAPQAKAKKVNIGDIVKGEGPVATPNGPIVAGILIMSEAETPEPGKRRRKKKN